MSGAGPCTAVGLEAALAPRACRSLVIDGPLPSMANVWGAEIRQ